ncbi:MAG: heme exporter protein CcmD [Gammaproteobacteria bacterium]
MQSLVNSPYAQYLLIAYGVTALVVIGNIVTARLRFRRTRTRLREQLVRRGAGRRQQTEPGSGSPGASGSGA